MSFKSPFLIFLPFILLFGVGCATEFNLATNREETLLYGTEKEVKIGDSVARQIEKEYDINTDVDINFRVQHILDRLVKVTDRRDIIYSIRVINEDKINAVSLPGGYIYVFKGLLDRIEREDQLAGVIAHEMGHITAKHGIKRLQNSYGYTLLQVAAVTSGDADVAYGVNAIATSVFLAHSRRDEFESDQLGVKYLKAAGYDPKAMIEVLMILQEAERKADLRRVSYFRTHPYLSERMGIVNKEITGQIGFKDYLNLTGNDL